MIALLMATLNVNVAANVVSPANDFSNLWPRRISFRIGGLITCLMGIVMQPWKLLADPSGYIFTWLLGYSGGLGSIAGVLIADYWLVRRTELASISTLPPRPQGSVAVRPGGGVPVRVRAVRRRAGDPARADHIDLREVFA